MVIGEDDIDGGVLVRDGLCENFHLSPRDPTSHTRHAGHTTTFPQVTAPSTDLSGTLNPEAWPKFPGWDRFPIVRTRKVDVFPYRVVYFIRDNELVIVAFAHQSRLPGYWKHRVER